MDIFPNGRKFKRREYLFPTHGSLYLNFPPFYFGGIPGDSFVGSFVRLLFLSCVCWLFCWLVEESWPTLITTDQGRRFWQASLDSHGNHIHVHLLILTEPP